MKRIFTHLLALLLLIAIPLAASAQDDRGSKKPGATAPRTATTKKDNKKSNSTGSKKSDTKKQSRSNQPSQRQSSSQSHSNQPSQPRTVQNVNTAPIANRTFTVNGVSFTMVGVQGGTFTMGATAEQGSDAYDDEKPAHKVTLSSFSIGATEVTQALWQAVMGGNPSHFTGNLQRPVETVSWDDCQAFINKLNALTGERFRLPTEAEWEYAARGGSKSRGCKYSGNNNIGNVAWYDGNSGSTTYPVATKSPNELGLYDMSGNVWEWCQDWYGSSYYSSSPSTNPTGPTSGSYRVHRGGCWYRYAWYCRVSFRGFSSAGSRSYYLGLRLAL